MKVKHIISCLLILNYFWLQYGEDGEKLERRRLNNRVAAQRCRQRKREYHLSLTKVSIKTHTVHILNEFRKCYWIICSFYGKLECLKILFLRQSVVLQEIQQWECNNTALKYDIHKLQKELQDLQQVLQQHQAECAVDPADLASAGSVKKSKKKSKKRSKSHKHKRWTLTNENTIWFTLKLNWYWQNSYL